MALLAYSLNNERTIKPFSLATLICKLTTSLKLVVLLVFGKVPRMAPVGHSRFGGHMWGIRGRGGAVWPVARLSCLPAMAPAPPTWAQGGRLWRAQLPPSLY